MDMSPRSVWKAKRLTLLLAALAAGLAAGCAGTGKSAIAPGADEVESGRGPLDYEAQRDGEVFVYDAETDMMVFRGDVEDGQEVRVDPERNRITVGGRTVSEQPLIRDHKYRIYFKRR
jgi:hypothetical protein